MASLAKYVKLETMQALLFNYYESSHFFIEGKCECTDYISHYPTRQGTNIVIIEAQKKQKDGRHIDWYVGTFEGPDMCDIEGKDGQEKFMENVKAILTRKNRVAGKNLQKRLEKILGEIRKEYS